MTFVPPFLNFVLKNLPPCVCWDWVFGRCFPVSFVVFVMYTVPWCHTLCLSVICVSLSLRFCSTLSTFCYFHLFRRNSQFLCLFCIGNSCFFFLFFFNFIPATAAFYVLIWARPWENVSYAICEQQRRRSACASAQSDQRLCCSLQRQNDTSSFYIRNFKILAGLCSWAVQFVSCLVGDSRRHIFSWRGSYVFIYCRDHLSFIDGPYVENV